jgi:hypothetical protein
VPIIADETAVLPFGKIQCNLEKTGHIAGWNVVSLCSKPDTPARNFATTPGGFTNASEFQARTKRAGEFQNKFLPLICIPGFLSRHLKNGCGYAP